MMCYVVFDGDHIGRMVGRARLADDVEEVRRVNQRIDHGNLVWKSWAESKGGNVVEMAGDEGALEVPADAVSDVPALRVQYQEKVQSTVSVGVGMRLSEAAKALVAAKLKGGDQVVFYAEEVDALIEEAKKKGEKTEEAKIADEYLNKASVEVPDGHKAGMRVPKGGSSCSSCKFLGDDGASCGEPHFVSWNGGHKLPAPADEYCSDWYQPKAGSLNKAQPAMNPGQNAGFAGAHPPSQPTTDKPVVAQGEHSEGQAIQDLVDDGPSPPEATHAAKDLERQLHDEAWKGEDEDMQQGARRGANLDQVRSQVARALQVLKVQAPIMEQVKQAAPQAYQAMVGLVQAVVGMARELSQPLAKAEAEDEPARLARRFREVPANDKGNTCVNGECYYAAEVLSHMLGGREAGWVPHVVVNTNPTGTAPHWYLRHVSGRVLDPVADHFQTVPPYELGRDKGFLTEEPSARARQIIGGLLGTVAVPSSTEDAQKDEMKVEQQPHEGAPGSELEKAKLPMPGAKAHHHVDLPSGSEGSQAPSGAADSPLSANKVKVTHSDGGTSWKQVEAGMIQSQDPARHPVSSREPSGR